MSPVYSSMDLEADFTFNTSFKDGTFPPLCTNQSSTTTDPGTFHHTMMPTDPHMAADVTVGLSATNAYNDSITGANQAFLPMLVSTGETSRSNRKRARTYTMLEGLRDSPAIPTDALPSIPRMYARDSTGTASTDRSSYDTVNTRGTSITSAGSRLSGETAPTNTVGTPSRASGRLSGPLLFCPPCNMGSGHVTGPYTKKNADTPGSNVSAGTPVPNETVVKFPNSWVKPAAFDRHMLELHTRFFLRKDTTEFICTFCECSVISHMNTLCPARFLDFNNLLEHMRDVHAQHPEELVHHHHWCGAIVLDAVTLLS